MNNNEEKVSNCGGLCKMNKTLFYAVLIGAFIMLLVIFIPKYINGNVTASGTEISEDIEKIEIIHFHGTNQCSSCIAVGNLAEKTVNTYYKEELKSSKITFQHLNAELSENYALAKKYGVKSASLWIGTYYQDGTFKAEENVNVWYKIGDEEDYMNYLKGVIENKLSGK